MGIDDGTAEFTVWPLFSNGNTYFRLNDKGAAVAASPSTPGLYSGSRTNSTTVIGYYNGSAIGTSTVSAVALPADTVTLLAENTLGSPASFNPSLISFAFAGGTIDAGHEASYYTRMCAFLTAVHGSC
jgi:hypothetical protein